MESSRKKTRCSLAPPCLHPKQDLATPEDQLLTVSAAARLRKRSERTKGDTSIPELCFPWNPATRAVATAASVATAAFTRRPADVGRPPCPVCKVSNSRDCFCGALFASETDLRLMSSFVGFVRAPGTPVYAEEDPRDQEQILDLVRKIFGLDGLFSSDEEVVQGMVRFASVAAFSGRPEVLDSLTPAFELSGSNADLVLAVNRACAVGPFFRGGQAHGRLQKSRVGSALTVFLADKMPTLTASCCQWGLSVDRGQRTAGVRIFVCVCCGVC